MPRGKAGELKPVAQRNDPLIAPLAKGPAGRHPAIHAGRQVLRTEPLVVQDAVERAGFFGRMVDTVKRWFNSTPKRPWRFPSGRHDGPAEPDPCGLAGAVVAGGACLALS